MKRLTVVRLIAVAIVCVAILASSLSARADTQINFSRYTGSVNAWVYHTGGFYISYSPFGMAFKRTSGDWIYISHYQCSDLSNVSPFEPYAYLNEWVYTRPNYYNETPLNACMRSKKDAGTTGAYYGILSYDG